jgi:hypothetical protein
MATFPAILKPVINKGYSFSSPESLAVGGVQGGLPLQARDLKFGPVPFSVALSVGTVGLNEFITFYKNDIFSGSAKFNMDLDSGQGVEPHVVQIEPQSLNIDGSKAPAWSISFSIIAESTPIQNGV